MAWALGEHTCATRPAATITRLCNPAGSCSLHTYRYSHRPNVTTKSHQSGSDLQDNRPKVKPYVKVLEVTLGKAVNVTKCSPFSYLSPVRRLRIRLNRRAWRRAYMFHKSEHKCDLNPPSAPHPTSELHFFFVLRSSGRVATSFSSCCPTSWLGADGLER